MRSAVNQELSLHCELALCCGGPDRSSKVSTCVCGPCETIHVCWTARIDQASLYLLLRMFRVATTFSFNSCGSGTVHIKFHQKSVSGLEGLQAQLWLQVVRGLKSCIFNFF